MAESRLSPEEAVEVFLKKLNEDLATHIKLLLETKHLYQHVTIPVPDTIKSIIDCLTFNHDGVRQWMNAVINKRIMLTSGEGLLQFQDKRAEAVPVLQLRNMVLFCRACDAKMVFAPVYYRDVTNELLKPSSRGEPGTVLNYAATSQLFFVAYQCQHCHRLPEGFLIRREKVAFFLDGRSPMVINFAEPARELGPLKLTKNGRVKHLQGLRYTNFEKLKKATSLDEAF